MSASYPAESRNGNPVGVDRSPTKAYNLLWIAPNFPASGKEFRQPISGGTIDNMLAIAEQNHSVDVRLWTDYKRMTQAQKEWLERTFADAPNLSLIDLWTIPTYNQHGLFEKPDNSPNWQEDKHSLIWRQVDTARLLASLQGDYDQSFYSDVDVTNLNVESDEVQATFSKHGVIVSGGIDNGNAWYENGLFAFDRSRRGLFNLLYMETLKNVVDKSQNGYQTLVDFFGSNSEVRRLGIIPKEVVFQARYLNHFDRIEREQIR